MSEKLADYLDVLFNFVYDAGNRKNRIFKPVSQEDTTNMYNIKKDNKFELKSASHEYKNEGIYKIMVKVIDILGVDTSQIIEIQVKK